MRARAPRPPPPPLPGRLSRAPFTPSLVRARARARLTATETQRYRELVRKDTDILCIDWLFACQEQGRFVTPKPRHYMHMGQATLLVRDAPPPSGTCRCSRLGQPPPPPRPQHSSDVDKYGDTYYSDVDSKGAGARVLAHAL